jgi:hypothetical protein
MTIRGINRAEIEAQCTRHCAAFALRSPPTSIIYFTILISSYATLQLLSKFQSSFIAIIVIKFLFVPTIYCSSPPPFLFVFALGPVLCCAFLLPLPSGVFVYGFLLLLRSLFNSTSHRVSLSLIYPLPFILPFLQFIVPARRALRCGVEWAVKK